MIHLKKRPSNMGIAFNKTHKPPCRSQCDQTGLENAEEWKMQALHFERNFYFSAWRLDNDQRTCLQTEQERLKKVLTNEEHNEQEKAQVWRSGAGARDLGKWANSLQQFKQLFINLVCKHGTERQNKRPGKVSVHEAMRWWVRSNASFERKGDKSMEKICQGRFCL